jgi:hypothetical protein
VIALLRGDGAAAFLDAQGVHYLLVAADGSRRASAGLADVALQGRVGAWPTTMR